MMSRILFWGLIIGGLYFFWEGAKKTYNYAIDEWVSPQIDAQEAVLGTQMLQATLAQEKEIKNTLANRCLDSIQMRLNAGSTHPIHIYLVDKKEVNAFAMLGNNIVVYSELLKKCNNADAVAGVLAHEIGHIRLFHVRKKILKEVGLNFLVSFVFGDSQGLITSVAQHIGSTAFDRNQEEEADQFAGELLHRQKIAIMPFVHFFSALAQKEDDIEKHLTLFSTHPNSDTRALKLENYALKHPFKNKLIIHRKWTDVQKSLSKY